MNSTPRSPPVIALALLAGLIALAPVAPVQSARAADANGAESNTAAWERTLHLVRDTFPDVPRMTTQQLAARLEAGRGDGIVLLDARTADEFSVSHLQGAVRATGVGAALRAVEAHAGKPAIVVYCSVGYRSSELAARLHERGVANVFNLEGSLFQWANEGRPLYRGAERVEHVHPFDEDWGQLLDKRYWPE